MGKILRNNAVRKLQQAEEQKPGRLRYAKVTPKTKLSLRSFSRFIRNIKYTITSKASEEVIHAVNL